MMYQRLLHTIKEEYKRRERTLILIALLVFTRYFLNDKPYFNLFLNAQFFTFLLVVTSLVLLRMSISHYIALGIIALVFGILAVFMEYDPLYSLSGILFYSVIIIMTCKLFVQDIVGSA